MKQFEQAAKDGLITLRKHPVEDIFVVNYTPKVQYERLWNDFLLQCRGLIIDSKGNIVAKSFPKFFNLEEHQSHEIPNEPFEVFDKLDGSLGIIFFYGGKLFVATRGSFESEQALKAQEIINNKDRSKLPRNLTLLVEIIYPQNQIVVNYGQKEELIGLTAFDENGLELDYNLFKTIYSDNFNIVQRFDGVKDFGSIRETFNRENAEGFVIRFKSGFRVKIKYEEYVRLHRIITQVSNKSIWDMIRRGESLDEILDRVPDEFYEYVRQTKKDLKDNFENIRNNTIIIFEKRPRTTNRKEFAFWAKEQENSSLLFALYDNKSIDEQIWKLVKPVYEKPFKTEKI